MVSESPFDEEFIPYLCVASPSPKLCSCVCVCVHRRNQNIPGLQYELPDGNMISVGPERFSIPESLFLPSAKTVFVVSPLIVFSLFIAVLQCQDMGVDLPALDIADLPRALHLLAHLALSRTDGEKKFNADLIFHVFSQTRDSNNRCSWANAGRKYNVISF